MTAIVPSQGLTPVCPGTTATRCVSSDCSTPATAVVDLSHRGVLTVTGPDRLSWLHSLTTQHLERPRARPRRHDAGALTAGPHRARALRGRRRRDLLGTHRARRGAAAVGWLDRMRFMMRVEVSRPQQGLRGGLVRRRPRRTIIRFRVGPDSLGGRELFVPRDRLDVILTRVPRRDLGPGGPPDCRRRAPDRP